MAVGGFWAKGSHFLGGVAGLEWMPVHTHEHADGTVGLSELQRHNMKEGRKESIRGSREVGG